MGLGISVSKGQNWTFAADLKFQKWSDYKNFSHSDHGLNNSLRFSIGGEVTPNPVSLTNYLERVSYRLGFSYEDTPYVINGQQVKDFGINFGWSLPVSRSSSLDMAFRFGSRGDKAKTIIDENYYKIYFGINFNDRWFIKRKFD